MMKRIKIQCGHKESNEKTRLAYSGTKEISSIIPPLLVQRDTLKSDLGKSAEEEEKRYQANF
jgi:hypothetical protein